MAYLQSLPAHATLKDLRERYAEPLLKLRPYSDALMRGPSPLSTAQRELIAAYVSGVNSCGYCYGVHSAVAAEFGVDEQLFEQLMNDFEAAPVDERLKPLLRYARKLTEAPARLTEQDAQAVHAAGWDDDALFTTVAVCALFNMMNRLVEGCGIEGSPEQHAAAAHMLAVKGYQG